MPQLTSGLSTLPLGLGCVSIYFSCYNGKSDIFLFANALGTMSLWPKLLTPLLDIICKRTLRCDSENVRRLYHGKIITHD